MQIDLRFASPAQGNLEVVVAPVLRFADVGYNAGEAQHTERPLAVEMRHSRTSTTDSTHNNYSLLTHICYTASDSVLLARFICVCTNSAWVHAWLSCCCVADVRIDQLNKPENIIAGFAPELFGRPLDDEDVLRQEVLKKGNITYYEW